WPLCSASTRLLFRFSARSGHNRDLPTFPTRRSSDLKQQQSKTELATDYAITPIGMFTLDSQQRFIRMNPVLRNMLDVSSTVLPQDRKSTRLNSSHVSISYAVFCLKKKIIPPPPVLAA